MDETPAINPVVYQACEAIGKVMELWGFKRIHGMVWTFIYLNPGPTSAQDVKAGLGISSGLASMTLGDLQHWDVVHRHSLPGERRDHYEAEINIWRPILKVLREREFYQMNATVEALREHQQALAASGAPADLFAAGKLEALIQLGDLALKLFTQFLELGTLVMRDTSRMAIASGMGDTLLALQRMLGRGKDEKSI
jgi:DNA-binding transcriptional regulator GbsR (MarR family)